MKMTFFILISMLFCVNAFARREIKDLDCTAVNGLKIKLEGTAGSQNPATVSFLGARRAYNILSVMDYNGVLNIQMTNPYSAMAGMVENYLISLEGDVKRNVLEKRSGYIFKNFINLYAPVPMDTLPVKITCKFEYQD